MNSDAMKELNVLVEGVHKSAANTDKLLSKVRERCHSFISSGKQEASNIVAEAEKQTEAMKAEASQTANNIASEAAIVLAAAEKQTEAMKIEIADWEEEKMRIARTHNFEPTITLDIGGHSFTTTLTTLTRFPDTMLGAMFSGRHALTKNEVGAHFIDRDGTYFREILNFLRNPESWDNDGFQGRQSRELKNEAEYYGLKDLMFPPPPPFVPAQPMTVANYSSYQVTITQDNDQLWYIQHQDFGVTPVVAEVCDTCGFGRPSGYGIHIG